MEGHHLLVFGRTEYYHTDEEGRTFDHYGRQVFGEDEAQTVSNSGDEEESLGVHPLEAGVFGVEGQDKGAEGTEDSNEILLAEVARKKEEERRRNLDLAERCQEEAAKIMKSGSLGGKALTTHTSIMSTKQLKVKKQPAGGPHIRGLHIKGSNRENIITILELGH